MNDVSTVYGRWRRCSYLPYHTYPYPQSSCSVYEKEDWYLWYRIWNTAGIMYGMAHPSTSLVT